ncbi:MAG: DUF2950 family protein [Planctomycetota bacterium]|jgi:hypothetical protein
MPTGITTAVVATALLVGGGVLVGAMAFHRAPGEGGAVPPREVPREVAPAPAEGEPLLRAGPGPSPETLEAMALRLDVLERTVGELLEEQAASRERMKRLGRALGSTNEGTPELGAMRAAANETAVIATLRNIASAQAQVQATGRIDSDADGVGEYGGFLELSGAVAGRMATPLNPPVMSSAFRRLTPEGVVVRSGYCFRVHLPDGGGEATGEPEGGFTDDRMVDSDLCETIWCCYAWPLEAGVTGSRTFFVNQMGDVLVTEDGRYSGPRGGPAGDAAFVGRGGIAAAAAVGQRGHDRDLWQVVR